MRRGFADRDVPGGGMPRALVFFIIILLPCDGYDDDSHTLLVVFWLVSASALYFSLLSACARTQCGTFCLESDKGGVATPAYSQAPVGALALIPCSARGLPCRPIGAGSWGQLGAAS